MADGNGTPIPRSAGRPRKCVGGLQCEGPACNVRPTVQQILSQMASRCVQCRNPKGCPPEVIPQEGKGKSEGS